MADMQDDTTLTAQSNQVVTLRVLIACEYSGRVREAFRKLGFDAWSCDLLPSDDNSPYHIQGDVLEILDDGWDMMIAHPPCTYFAQAGMHYLKTQPGRWEKHAEMLNLWSVLWNAPIDHIAMENPVGWLNTNWRKPDQIINPFNFGIPERKQTCLWLKNLPKLKDTNNVKDQVKPTGYVIRKSGPKKGQRYNYYWRQSKTGHERSLTFQCIADAMSQQWGTDLPTEGYTPPQGDLEAHPKAPTNTHTSKGGLG